MKSFTFAKKDAELLKKIERYQDDNNIDTLTETVRQLLKYALDIKELDKNNS